MLNLVRHGLNTAPPLVIAHGLFGSARNWNILSKRLSDTRQVLAVDMRNHGASPWFQSQTYANMAADLAEVIDGNGGKADVLGHSMGGKAAMVLALSRPQMVQKLLIADIAPVGYAHTQMHLVNAMCDIDPTHISSRREAGEELQNLVPDATVRAFLLQSLDMKSTPPRWLLNLDVLKGYMTDIVGFPNIEGQFSGPTLFLSGSASDYILPEYHVRILELFPNAEFQQIEGSGHWLHAEKPREFELAVRGFLDKTRAG